MFTERQREPKNILAMQSSSGRSKNYTTLIRSDIDPPKPNFSSSTSSYTHEDMYRKSHQVPTPSNKRRSSAQMAGDSEEYSGQSWSDGAGSLGGSKKRKRGPGRPRKPDHELARPRRPRTPKGGEQSSLKFQHWTGSASRSGNDGAWAEGIAESDGVGKRDMVVSTSTQPTEDQVTIAAQQRQIEAMREKIQHYEARIKAMEILQQYHQKSTPPTPAMSINQSSTLHYTYPLQNPPRPPPIIPTTGGGAAGGARNNATRGEIDHAHPNNMTEGGVAERTQSDHDPDNDLDNDLDNDREDSPLSVYSDLWTEDLLSATSTLFDTADLSSGTASGGTTTTQNSSSDAFANASKNNGMDAGRQAGWRIDSGERGRKGKDDGIGGWGAGRSEGGRGKGKDNGGMDSWGTRGGIDDGMDVGVGGWETVGSERRRSERRRKERVNLKAPSASLIVVLKANPVDDDYAHDWPESWG